MENMELWDKVKTSDPKSLKEVTFGRGFTSISAYHQIKKASLVIFCSNSLTLAD